MNDHCLIMFSTLRKATTNEDVKMVVNADVVFKETPEQLRKDVVGYTIVISIFSKVKWDKLLIYSF